MRFFTFDTIHEELDHDHPDEFGMAPTVEIERHKICVNLSEISSIEQTGQWKRRPDAPARPRNSRPLTQARVNRDIFVINTDRFYIHFKKGIKTIMVLGKFEEFADILSQFQDRETT